MSFFYKLTYSGAQKRLSIYNWGCNFNCKICTYKIRSPYAGEVPLEMKQIKPLIKRMYEEQKINKVHFLGGEPTTNPYLSELVDFINLLGLTAHLGHTNGTNLIAGVSSMTISIKAVTANLHLDYTGVSNKRVLENISIAYKNGITIKTNTVFIPNYVDLEEIAKIANFLSSLSPDIPLHIIGYIPVPGLPFRKPHKKEILEAVKRAMNSLHTVTWSLFSKIEEINYKSKRIL
ncbi:MAG TPA: radical SAM protein [bacterium (Candidatus Stahlbacteria)]|nr:radical SAM protein [Candidatus Stahlbacteria bacterium]